MSKLFMSEQDIKTLMTLAKKDPRDYALLKLMASTGLRVSDIVRLRRDEMVDSDREIVRSLRIKMAKTDRWIDRALREDAREAVQEYLCDSEGSRYEGESIELAARDLQPYAEKAHENASEFLTEVPESGEQLLDKLVEQLATEGLHMALSRS